ncbi:MAG: protein-disulfide reductase DsbD domain-containing protein, partial [Bacteroidia bacterium]
MRVLSTLLVLIVGLGNAVAQQFFDPVDIKYSLDYLGDNEVEVSVSLDIEEGWHTYSLTQDNPMGPLATVLEVKDSSVYKKIGGPYSPSKVHKEFEPAFDMEVEYYDSKAVFKQKIKLTNTTTKVNGVFEYQVCNNERCLPPAFEPFELEVKDGYYVAAVQTDERATSNINFGSAPADEDENEIEGEMFDPVSWNFSAKNLGENIIEITAKPIIEEGWHLYADLGQDLPIPTTFWLKDSVDGYKYTIEGENWLEPALTNDEKHMDELFGVEVAYVGGERVFKQKVRLKEALTSISGELEYQVCDDQR